MKAENRRVERGVINIAIVDVETLARNWWLVLLRGIAGIIFGVLTFLWPSLSLTVLVIVFGAYAFADGVLAIISAIRWRGETERWWLILLEGLAGVAAGVITFFWPAITALALLYIIAAWALVTGALEIAAAIKLRKIITGEWLLVLSGVASIALGVLLALFPGPGALALVFWIGAFAIVSGALLIALAFKLRSWGRSSSPRLAHGMA
jgi:uncharacterized membrane protein HdeD (DUF308 family)